MLVAPEAVMLNTSEVACLALAFLGVVLWVAALGDISRRRFPHPHLKTVWLLFVIFGVWVGAFFYVLIGRKQGRLSEKMAS